MATTRTTDERAATEAGPRTPAGIYERRRARFAAERDVYNRRRYLSGNATVVSFVAAVVCFTVGLFTVNPLYFALAGLLLAAFVAAFGIQAYMDGRYIRSNTLVALNDEGLLRLRRDWAALPLRQPPASPADHQYAGDLDLLGHASLQHLLGGAGTPSGQITLQRWLLAPAAPAAIRERQTAVKELAPQSEFRDELALGGRLMNMTPAALGRFLAWAEGVPWLARRPWLIWLAWLSPLLLFTLLAAQFTGWTRYPFWLLPLGLNLLLTATYGKHVEGILEQVAERQAVFKPYAGIFRLITSRTFTAPALRREQAALAGAGAGGVSAEEQMRRLGRIMQFGDFRLSMFFAVIQATTLWNFHTLWLLERWRRTAGASVRGWLDTLSELDALAALGTLAFEQPDWAFPEVAGAPTELPRLEARNLGHPLLPSETCVGNDVSVGPRGTFLFVTGSNMSGKSTLLRSLGTNIVLAQMGAPVCADALRMPPIALATSIRVQDSLEQGVSYFLAELRRLKDVMEATRTVGETSERLPFFLLDEILHGTNTSERQIAARSILRHLLALGATGAVSTHDLTLTDTPDLEAARTAVHFTEQFTRGPEGPSMRFDYRLRPGVATSTNALKLMEIVGLPVEGT